MSLALILCSVVAMACAAYGTYAFSNNVTCRIAPGGKIKQLCVKVAWIPSACVVVLILGIAVFRSSTNTL